MITHDAILAALAELRTTAEAADNPLWLRMITDASMLGRTAAAKHGGNWNPHATLRWLSWAEQVAAEHEPQSYVNRDWPPHCNACVCDSPCKEYARLIGALGLEET